MKTLHLTLKKKWFDMVGNGKPEEYREIKPYWNTRLMNLPKDWCLKCTPEQIEDNQEWYKNFDDVEFINGYGDRPKKIFEFKGIEIREGNPEWGAVPGKKYFVIKLGKQI